MTEDPTKDIKKEDLLKTLEGDKLEQYQELENSMNIKQCKTSRATMKGLMLRKKKLDLRRLYKNSKNPDLQQKYKEWQADVKRMEEELIRWDLTIDAKKEQRRTQNEQEQ